jgi:ferredoxin-NADP reductase
MSDQKARWSLTAVAGAREVADGIKEIVLRYDHPAPAAPGSHIDVAVRVGNRDEIRSYSVVTSDSTAKTVTIAVRLATGGGGGSRYLHGLIPGDRLRATDPLQGFALTLGREGYVLVAAGIGITPLLPMFRTLRASGAQVRLVYAGRHRRGMAFVEELAGDREQVELVVSAEGDRLDAAKTIAAVPENHELYVCGPLGLLDALRAAWRDAGRSPGRFRFETFGSSGRHAPEEFVVEIPRLSLRTTVPPNVSILDALRQAGAETMSDCRRGECGLCEVRVLECTGLIDHRDVFLSDAQHAEGNYLCTCVTRVVARGEESPKLVLDLP